jgi:succinate dehydrogenase / fumarate reductase cytochrome b subunit
MFASGAVVLAFVLLHLMDLRFGLRPDVKYLAEENPEAPFRNTVAVLTNPVSRLIYLVGVLILGVHLSHGFSSAFQSIVLNHTKYMPLIKVIGLIFAVVIAIGFASIVVIVPGLKH